MENDQRAAEFRRNQKLEQALEKPLAMKGMYLNWNIPFLDSIFDKALFVHVKRDPLYVIQSLLESRQKFFGAEEKWYSVRPLEYAWLKDRGPVTQAAGQVYYTCKAVEAGMTQVAEARRLMVDYERFCESPAETWDAIRSRMAAQGYSLNGVYRGAGDFLSQMRFAFLPGAGRRFAKHGRQSSGIRNRSLP